jgi:hypothetical protein
MPALVAGIHALTGCETKDVDGRDEPGHDVRGAFANLYLRIFTSAGSISPDRKNTGHVSRQMFHAKQIQFQGLRKPHE